MPALARYGKGTGTNAVGPQLKRAATTTAGDTNYTLIDLLKGSLSLGGSADQKDISSFDTQGRIRQKASGMIDLGSVDVEMWFDPDWPQHQNVLQDFQNGDLRDYQLLLPTGVTRKYGFRATTSQFKLTMPLDDHLMATLSFTVFTVNFNA